MGPLRDSKEQRVYHHQEKVSRSRIPRLVLRPHAPQQLQKLSPASESPFSEEESREFNLSSSGRSARTISSNSFCSDDTGCPSSQSVSPVKTPSEAGTSPIGFCPGSDEDFTRKNINIGAVVEGNSQPGRHKKDQKTTLVKPGRNSNRGSTNSSWRKNIWSEADFSSSSSTGSISAPEVHMSAAGSKRPSFSRNGFPPPWAHSQSKLEEDQEPTSSSSRGSHGRNSAASSYKCGVSPPSREKDLLSMLARNQLSPVNAHPNYGPSSPSSSNSGSYKGSDSSPVLRRAGRYSSCGESHGVKPPNPEQYLTPLQQKEVTVRHLKTKLKESESQLQERETEISELKSQLTRMRDDWIEEECHRVEAQLALKEARKEIKQLKQVIETMRSSLADKDKGIQKYFVDINIQNTKLESLLQCMEMAQNGSFREELCLEYLVESPGQSVPLSPACTPLARGRALGDQAGALEELEAPPAPGNLPPGLDLFEEIMTAATTESGEVAVFQSSAAPAPPDQMAPEVEDGVVMEQVVQLDTAPCGPGGEQLLWKMPTGQGPHPGTAPAPAEAEASDGSPSGLDSTAGGSDSAILVSPVETRYSEGEADVGRNQLMRELDFGPSPEDDAGSGVRLSRAGVGRRYWSKSLMVDLLAVAAPMVPTVLWVLGTQRGGTDPIYNIGALLRGCCLVALPTLRRAPFQRRA
ncbi:syntabulin isoform X2 [Tachyglossus aculeatus]|uniref:syntabulin isoform X2 n=1 Tax=Tachyglossus aculeatus TaxID=9261 RepID=UPI0018F61A79|nr:syntabulin isoform X2 [Tachyglossus aculeatus]XP_038601244.1 syntabulin isoform X2 [Tachyglossus aculeatus]